MTPANIKMVLHRNFICILSYWHTPKMYVKTPISWWSDFLSKMSRIADSGGHLEFEGQELMKSLKQP